MIENVVPMRQRQWMPIAVLLAFAVAGLAHPAAAEDEPPLSAAQVRDVLLRGPVVRPKIDAEGYTTSETSTYISMPSVRFDLDSAVLRPASKKQLDQVALALTEIATRGPVVRPKPSAASAPEKPAPPPQRFLIEGHTCDRGAPAHNLDLSKRRARVVRDYLIAKGVDNEILETRGWGEERPVKLNTTEDGRSRNRRVDFVLRQHEDALLSATRGLFTSSTTATRFLDVNFDAISLADGGRRYANADIDVLKSGDRFKARFRVLEGCHVYVLFLSSQNEVEWLFPSEDVGYGLWCYLGEEHHLPNATESFFLDDRVGREALYVIATHSPISQPGALPAILMQHGTTLTAEILRAATGTDDAELYMLTIDHR